MRLRLRLPFLGFLSLGLLPAFGLAAVPAAAAVSAASAASAVVTSFDCGKASAAAEKAVCNDPMLAGLDRETARLYALAAAAPGLSTQGRKTLAATQRGWIKGRNDCWKAADATACIRDSYLMRIAELRSGHAAARRQDDQGLSHGPVAVRCPGMKAVIYALFVNVQPELAWLHWGDRSLTLSVAPSGSGARYTAGPADADGLFWQKGPSAFVQLPGGKQMNCRVAIDG